MTDIKEKSAPETAISETEKRIYQNKSSITESDKKVKVVIQHPGEISRIAEIENSISAVNDIVGGLSTVVTTDCGLYLIIHAYEDTRKKPNIKTVYCDVSGTVIMAACENGSFVNLTPEQIQMARSWLLKHTI